MDLNDESYNILTYKNFTKQVLSTRLQPLIWEDTFETLSPFINQPINISHLSSYGYNLLDVTDSADYSLGIF